MVGVFGTGKIKRSLKMKKITTISTLIIMAMLILSACATQKSVNTPQPPISTQVVPTDVGQQVITLADQGKTIDLAVGESFLLQLGEEYAWDVTISDQNVVSRVKNITVIRGAQGVYNALQAGTVTLSATGDPVCLQAKPPCAKPSIMFTITIIVK
jgi:hypothetical protein